jgi:predicted outer membrane repeat protein
MKRILIVLTSLSLIAGFVAATPRPATAAPSFSSYGGDTDLVVSQYGSSDGIAVGAGTCAEPNFNTVQDAVDYAELEWGSATSIFICNGIYYEQIDATIGLTLVGEHKLKTILDGSQNVFGDGIIFHAPLGDDSISIWDMTIRNGDGDNGGALYTDGNFYCSNSVFSGNSASSDGGAVYVDSEQDASVQNCSFLNNNAGDEGGALYVTDSFASERSIYANNQAVEQGGAVHADELNYSRLDLFHNNESVENDGGAIYVYSGNVASVIDRSVFRQNTATERGGAVYYDEEYRLTITSSSFIGNSSTGEDGGAISLKGDDSDDYLIITGGPRTPTIFQGNYSAEDGGAISVDDDNGSNGMSVTNARFTDNIAGYSGGAIESDNEINLYSTTFTGNRAGDAGGAVSADEATTVSRSTFTRNTAVSEGGGAISASDNLTVTSSTFTYNTADNGGAIKAANGTLTVEGSTFTGNQAQGDLDDGVGIGGACDDDGPAFCAGEGGAIFTSAEETLITRSTFKNNSATDEGGAIMGDEDGGTPELRIRNSTFIGNQAEEAGALSSRTLYFIELRGNLFQANRAYGVDFTPNFNWAVGAVMVETAGLPWVIAGNRFISNVGWGVGALYLVDDCGVPFFNQASMRANTWRSNRVTGGQPQIYRDVRTEGSDFC